MVSGFFQHALDKSDITTYFKKFGKVVNYTDKEGKHFKTGHKFVFVKFEDSKSVEKVVGKWLRSTFTDGK